MSFISRIKFQKIALLSGVLLATGSLWAVSTLSVSAAANQLYFTPASRSQAINTTFTVDLRVNPAGGAIDTVNASVSYDGAKLSLQGVDCSGSPFTPQPSPTLGCPNSGNPVTITGATFSGPISTDSFVARLTFKALVGSGSGNINVTGDTARNGSSLGASGATTVVSFTTPAPPTCAAGQTGTYPNCVTPPSGSGSGGSSGSSGGSTKPPTGGTKPPTTGGSTPPATDGSTTTTAGSGTATVSTKDLKFTKATFTVTSKDPTQVYIQFGTDKNALTKQTTLSELGTSHKVTIDPKLLTPGQTYYYVVVSKTQAGATTQTVVDKFTMNGLTVRIGAFGKENKPLAGKKITLHSTPMTATTDSKGYASFANVVPGSHEVQYTEGGKTYTQQVTVDNTVTAEGDTEVAPVQTLSVVYGLTASKSLTDTYRWVILGLLVVVAVVAAVLFSQRKVRFAAPEGAPLSVEPIVVGNPTNSNIVTPAADGTSSTTPKAVETNQRLSSIPAPNKPMPGTTVAPVPEERKQV